MRRDAFTLIELLVVITIIGILVGLLAVGVMAVRRSAQLAQARASIAMLDQAMGVYRAEDLLRRFPPPPASGWIEFAAAGQPELIGDRLADAGLGDVAGRRPCPGVAGRALVDPWGAAVEYRLDANMDGIADRPLDGDGLPVRVPDDLTDWNPRALEPFSYLWSWGRPLPGSRQRSRAADWIYIRQDPSQP